MKTIDEQLMEASNQMIQPWWALWCISLGVGLDGPYEQQWKNNIEYCSWIEIRRREYGHDELAEGREKYVAGFTAWLISWVEQRVGGDGAP